MFDAEDVQFDLERFYHEDREINEAYEKLRAAHIAKGLVYTEVAKSKSFGTIKYIIKEYPQGWVSITDLDSGEIFAYGPPREGEAKKPLSDREKIQQWIRRAA